MTMIGETDRKRDDTAETQPDEFALDQHINHLLRKTSQRASEIFQHVMRDLEVTPPQFAALMQLKEEGECSQNALGRLTAMDAATILDVVARLQRRGLVERRLHPNDRRYILLYLSEEGEKLVGEMQEAAASMTQAILSPLTSTEAKALMRLLRKLSPHRVAGPP